MPFTIQEDRRLLGCFLKGEINELALIIVQKVFNNLTPEERINWFDNILVHCENAIRNHNNAYHRVIEQTDINTISVGVINLSNQLFNMFQNMALEGKFREPPIK